MPNDGPLRLVDFLTQRIDADAATAHYAKREPFPDMGGWWLGHYQHVTAWSPDRVLAECAAKRRVMEQHYNGSSSDYERCSPCDTVGEACLTLRALASAYAHHPDYREEWAL